MFDKVIIIDESAVQDTTPAVLTETRPTAFIPIFSNRGYGRDNELKLFQGYSQATLVNQYGTPNMATTMTPLYYAYEFLRGGGDVYVRRIVSSTSTLAHAIIVAKVRTSTPDPENPSEEVLEVKFEIQTIPDARDLDRLIVDAEALLDNDADVDGYKTFPIALASLTWSGSEGNRYTFRLLPNNQLDRAIDQRGYQIEVRRTAGSSPTTVQFSTHEDATLDGTTIYANDYVEESFPNLSFTMLSTANNFLEEAAPYLPEGEEYPDIFFGRGKDGVVYPRYTIQGSSVDFTSVGGIAFAGGGDGDFGTAVPERVTNMMTRYAESFNEIPTLLLVNEYRYFIDYVFDFGAPQEVKDALIGFAGSRQSTQAIIDTGLERSASTILNMRKNGDVAFNNESASIVTGRALTRDPFTNKKIAMPLSFFEAFAIPNHITTIGGERPFAGNAYAYTNMLPGTYEPYFYDENADIVREFVENRLNFAMEDDAQYTAFHQSTSLKTQSALIERCNVYLLKLLIRVGLRTAKAQRWNFAEDSDIENYQSILNQNISNALEGKLGEFELTAEREGNIGEARNRVLVTGRVRFKHLNKGTTFQFTVV